MPRGQAAPLIAKLGARSNLSVRPAPLPVLGEPKPGQLASSFSGLFFVADELGRSHSAPGNGVRLPLKESWETRLDYSSEAGFGIMWNALWIFAGGGLGSLARWWFSGWVANTIGQTFPWGTLLINISGSFLIGLFATVTGPDGRWLARDSLRQFFMYGVCGGYTTFSSFSLQTLTLAQDGEWFKAAANCVMSLVLCLAGVWLGHVLALEINSMKG